MKYLCSVGQVIEAETPEEAKSQFLRQRLVFKLEDVDCIEFDLNIPDTVALDANEVVDLVEDKLSKYYG